MTLHIMSRSQIESELPGNRIRMKDGGLWQHVTRCGPNLGYKRPVSDAEARAGIGFYIMITPPPDLRGQFGDGI